MSKFIPKIMAASDGKPVEILVHGPIGKSFWSDEGISGKEVTDAINSVPRGTKFVIGVNSQGGAVGEGLAIYNAISRRREDATVRIDGYALSIASFFPLAASRVVSPKSSVWMIHKAWNWSQGNSDQLRKDAKLLDTHDSVIASAYEQRTGKSRGEITAAMEEETWFTGEEAIAYGLADEESNNEPDLMPLDLAPFKNVPSALSQYMLAPSLAVAASFNFRRVPVSAKTQSTPTPHMTNTPVPAEPITPPVTPAPQAAAPAAPAVTAAQFAALQAQLDAERTKRITNEVNTLAAQNTAIDAAAWLPRVLADESLMATLRTIPQQDMGNQPIRAVGVQNLGNPAIEAYRNLGPSAAHMLKTGEMPRLTAAQARARIAHRRDHGAHIEAQFQKFAPQAANTFSSTLKPDALIDGLIVVANNRLAPLRAFSTQFSADPVRPMAVIQVKKATAGATGQTNPTNLESGDSTLAPISVTMAHKTQSFHVDIPDRNWSASLEDLAQINAQAFSNLLSDVYTAVMTVANYGAATAVGVAATFQYDSLKPVLAAAKNYRAKNLLLDGGHRAYLAPTDKFGFEFANNGVPAFGFDLLAEQNRWTSAATNACGFVCSPDALGVATGLPVTPATGQYDMNGSFALADLGISVGYKAWFNTATGIQWAMYEIMIGAGAGDTTQAEVLVTS